MCGLVAAASGQAQGRERAGRGRGWRRESSQRGRGQGVLKEHAGRGRGGRGSGACTRAALDHAPQFHSHPSRSTTLRGAKKDSGVGGKGEAGVGEKGGGMAQGQGSGGRARCGGETPAAAAAAAASPVTPVFSRRPWPPRARERPLIPRAASLVVFSDRFLSSPLFHSGARGTRGR